MSRRTRNTAIAVLIGFLMLSSLYLHVSRQLLFSDDAHHNASTISIVPLQPQRNLAIQEEMANRRSISPAAAESVLLPDWQVIVISTSIDKSSSSKSCLFQNGATSRADFAGVSSGHRLAFICSLPPSLRRVRPFLNPQLVDTAGSSASSRPATAMARWNRLAYDSFSTPHDVIVFAKGINHRRTARTLRCVFSIRGVDVDVTNVTSSSQEVFRCGHPINISPDGEDDVRVSVKVVGEDKLSTVAIYKKPPAVTNASSRNHLLCASTMVYNASKFLPEWVRYHAAVGVEKFIIYDNGSEDDLRSTVAELREVGGYDLSVVYWPWPKTQEASFSHSAATNRDSCAWMAFVDVDEFVFSPAWSHSVEPGSTMLSSMLPPIGQPGSRIGQVSINCLEFGPTGHRAHPKAGVTQGYTCRKHAENRHKSILRLEAVDFSLANSVHHFRLDWGSQWETKWFGVGDVAVNHYKFQAWEEFRVKFRRRASSYVADWKESVNPGSKDRTPGLGFDPVEPDWWAQRQSCEVNDTRLRDLTRRWFGGVGPDAKMAWEGVE